MKQTLILAGVLSIGYANAQEGRVGINTEQPQATLDVREKPLASLPAGMPQGVLFPKFTTAERSNFTEVKEGTMIYNTTERCWEIYTLRDEQKVWKCMSM